MTEKTKTTYTKKQQSHDPANTIDFENKYKRGHTKPEISQQNKKTGGNTATAPVLSGIYRCGLAARITATCSYKNINACAFVDVLNTERKYKSC